jgi:hypothetical protein
MERVAEAQQEADRLLQEKSEIAKENSALRAHNREVSCPLQSHTFVGTVKGIL